MASDVFLSSNPRDAASKAREEQGRGKIEGIGRGALRANARTGTEVRPSDPKAGMAGRQPVAYPAIGHSAQNWR